MSEPETQRPLVRRAEDVEAEPVDAAEGLTKAVLVGEEHGAPNLAIRRFTLAPGAEVPKHINEIEHEQYVLSGEYVVGIDGEASETPRKDGEASETPRKDGEASETPRKDGETSETPRRDGEAVAGEEHTVSAGDALHIPAGVVHWYRNEGETEGAFICAVPTGDDSIDLVEE